MCFDLQSEGSVGAMSAELSRGNREVLEAQGEV
jgi:hypothetical protein